jgi:hypothetical protein
MKEINLPCHGIKIELTQIDPDKPHLYVGGIITSDFDGKRDVQLDETPRMLDQFGVAINTLESMILACACAGIDVESPAFIEAIEVVADKISNEFGD